MSDSPMAPRNGQTMAKDKTLSIEARVAQGGGEVSAPWGDVVPPIYMATTYQRERDLSYPTGVVYTRDQNPSYLPAQKMLCELEGGADALLYSSGMAAIHAVVTTLRPGDRIVAPRVMYWAARHFLIQFGEQWGLTVDFFDPPKKGQIDSTGAANLERLLSTPADLVWLETPANPTWDVTDIARVAQLAHAAGAQLGVDSTTCTPVLTQPLALGADIVMHSATKYLNGHSDVLAGALVCREQSPMWQKIKKSRGANGAVLGPFEAWLLARGMRTLFPRVRLACESAMALARHFDAHPALAQVLYPGLPNHLGHQIAKGQMKNGFGGMLAIRVAGGEQASIDAAARLKVFKRATSLGSTESLVEHRASIEGDDSPCPRDLLRLSIGIEPVAELIADIEQALAQ